MDDQGLVELAGQADVGGEGGPLGVPGRVVVVVVQPRLPHPDHPLVGQQPAQLLEGGPGEAVGVVGVDPGGRRHLGQPGGVGGGLPAGGQVDPDVDQVPDALGGRLGHHLLGRGLQQVQVAVGVDQHGASMPHAGRAPLVSAACRRRRRQVYGLRRFWPRRVRGGPCRGSRLRRQRRHGGRGRHDAATSRSPYRQAQAVPSAGAGSCPWALRGTRARFAGGPGGRRPRRRRGAATLPDRLPGVGRLQRADPTPPPSASPPTAGSSSPRSAGSSRSSTP